MLDQTKIQVKQHKREDISPKSEHAVVLLSGGQDSITCLGWALMMFASVQAVSFNYGQRHASELESAQNVCDEMNIKLEVFETDVLKQLGDSALLTEGADVTAAHSHKPNLPASYVPNRNAFMLTLAHAYAQKVGATRVVTGVCQTDYSGYPDCRLGFINALERALNAGAESKILIDTPLMFLDKKETFQLAEEIGFLPMVIEHARTCYNGDIETRHDWGTGCGTCPSCTLKKAGYEQFIAAKGED